MDSASPLLVALSTLSCVALALAVALRCERTPVSNAALALLLALVLWSGGLALGVESQPGAWRSAGLRTAALGMFAASGLWLLLALRHRWPRRLGGGAAMAVALAPAGLFFAVAITQPRQCRVGWVDWLHPAQTQWAQPLVLALLALAFACGLAGTSLFSLSALRLWRLGERRSGVGLGLVMLAQPIALFAALRSEGGPTPIAAASLTLAVLVLSITALRYQLLEPPPLGHRQVIDHLRDGVVMANAAGEILDHNAAAERLLGIELHGRAIADAIAALARDEDRESIHAALARLEDDPEPVSLRLESARNRHLEVWVRPILGEDRLVGQVATLRDRTDERRYAESVLRAQQLETVGTLAGGIAHEVNNPLAFVRANLAQIARMAEIVDARRGAGPQGSKLADELGELGEIARESLAGLGRIERAVSDVRRLAAAPSAGHAAVSLDIVVRDAVRLLELRAGSRVAVETRLAADLPEVQGSAQLLVQALLSLLLDAQQALDGAISPRIEIETGADRGSVWVRVRDNGPPMPEELRERTFAPFFSTASDPVGRARSLRLGITAGIIADHGGSLCSEPCESGAVFLLRLAVS